MRAVVPHQLAVVGVASERPVQACAPNTARASDALGLRIKAEGGASPSRLKAWPPLPLWNQCPRTWKFPRLSRKIPGSSVWLAQAGAVPMRLNGASQDGLRSVMRLRLAKGAVGVRGARLRRGSAGRVEQGQGGRRCRPGRADHQGQEGTAGPRHLAGHHAAAPPPWQARTPAKLPPNFFSPKTQKRKAKLQYD